MRLGFEDQHVSVRRHAELRETLPDRVELVPAGGLVEAERAVKEPAEIDGDPRRRRARRRDLRVGARSAGWSGGPSARSRSRSSTRCASRGAEDPSFPSIVAAAENGALPHAHAARRRRSPPDTLVTLDIGARVDGYCSDCTRTWATGELDGRPRGALRHGAAARRRRRSPRSGRGPTGREVDAVARDLIAAAGHGEHFGHGLGHGVGLDVHEAPRLARTAEARLEAGHVVTVEPGIYLPGRGGARIEDLVVVTRDGHEVLSDSPKGPRVVA